MQIGVTTQVSLLGLALSDRIRRLRIDRDQAQAILRLTLPDVIADRLKAGEKYIADRHSRVAVLFADLAGFTPLSATAMNRKRLCSYSMRCSAKWMRWPAKSEPEKSKRLATAIWSSRGAPKSARRSGGRAGRSGTGDSEATERVM